MKLSQIRLILVCVTACAMMLCMTSCKASKTETADTTTPAVSSANQAEPEQAKTSSEDDKVPAETAAVNDAAANGLPAYQFSGEDPIQKAIANYLIHEIGKNYEPSDVCIPSIAIVGTDSTNPDDIRVWGDFWIFNYKRNNDMLETASGGSYPGLIHLKKADDIYIVTKMDVVADGSDNLKSAKEIFGDKFDDFHKINSNREEREKIRLQFISDYVKANKLPITKTKDFGWDPVTLP